MNAKEISQLENVELDDNALIPVYTESEGTGKTSLENIRKAMGVNSLEVTVEELSPHSKPTADIEKKNVSDFSMSFGIPKTNAIESHTVEESTDENGLRKNTITDTLSDATQKTYEVKDGIGIKETKVEQKDGDSQISKITLTFTDGTTKEVDVHNGKGIESIEYTPSNLSKGENKIKVKYSDGTESNQFSVLNGKDFRIVHSFKSEEERENSNFKWTDEAGEHEIELFDFVMIDTGSVEDEESGRLYSCAEENGAKAWHYHGDISGCKGDSGTIEIGSVEGGEVAEVENVGTPQSAILNFKLPKGDKGDSATVEVGTVETIAPEESASVENAGDEHNAIFNFKLPRGSIGEQGPKGDKGDTGATGPQGPKGDSVGLSAINTFGSNNNFVLGSGIPNSSFCPSVSSIISENGVYIASKIIETSGIHLNGNNIVMWTPCDEDAIRVYDEDGLEEGDTSPLARLGRDGRWYNPSGRPAVHGYVEGGILYLNV